MTLVNAISNLTGIRNTLKLILYLLLLALNKFFPPTITIGTKDIIDLQIYIGHQMAENKFDIKEDMAVLF